MPTKTIATQIKDSFSRYILNCTNVYRYKWTQSLDEDETINVVSPLNGLTSVDAETAVESKEIDPQLSETNNAVSPLNGLTSVDAEMTAETNKEIEFQLSFDQCQKEDGNIIGCDAEDAHETERENSPHFHSTQELLRALEESLDSIADQQFCEDVGVNVPDNELAIAVNDELSEFIKFIDERGEKCTLSEQKEIELIVGADPKNEADFCIYDSSYDLKQDRKNPFLFHLCVKTSNNPTNRSPHWNLTGCKPSSIYFNDEEIKSCFIPLQDFRIKRRKPNPLENIEFFVDKKRIVDDVPVKRRTAKSTQQKQPTKSASQKKNSVRRPKRLANKKQKQQQPTPPPLIQVKTVDQHETLVPMLQSNPIETPVPETKTISIEEKTVSINEWLHLSSQVQPDNNNVDVSEFLQFASLPILTEIEDDAFQLVQYLEVSDQTKNETRKDDPITDLTQPLDLSMKQTTPMSTDTGFCNDATPPYRPSPRPMAGPNYAWTTYNRNYEKTNVENGSEIRFKANQTNEEFKLSPKSSTAWRPNPVNGTPDKEQKCFFQPTSLLMDWKADNYSTDLDYEPDDSDDEPDVTFNSEFRQNINATPQPNEMAPSPGPIRRWKNLVIDEPNDESDSRVVTEASNILDSKSTSINPLQQFVAQFRQVLSPPANLLETARDDDDDHLLKQITYLFNRPCFDYMAEKNCKDGCHWNHYLPSKREVYRKLMLFPAATVKSIYSRFIGNNRMSFVTYFPIVCKVLAILKMKPTLLAAIKHCEHHGQLQFYMDIYHGLIRLDSSKLDALSEIAKMSCKTRVACTFILNIIVKEDCHVFIEMLKKFYAQANVHTHHMEAIMYQLIDNPAPSLLNIFINMLDKYSIAGISDVNSYKILLYHAKKFVKYDFDLMQRLNCITARNNTVQLL